MEAHQNTVYWSSIRQVTTPVHVVLVTVVCPGSGRTAPKDSTSHDEICLTSQLLSAGHGPFDDDDIALLLRLKRYEQPRPAFRMLPVLPNDALLSDEFIPLNLEWESLDDR